MTTRHHGGLSTDGVVVTVANPGCERGVISGVIYAHPPPPHVEISLNNDELNLMFVQLDQLAQPLAPPPPQHVEIDIPDDELNQELDRLGY